MQSQTRLNWGEIIRLGLLVGIIALALCLIGMVESFNERHIIGGVFTLGQILLFGPVVGGGYLFAQRNSATRTGTVLLGGLLLGLISSLPLVVLIFLGQITTPEGQPFLRQFLPNVSPGLLDLLTFGLGAVLGSLILALLTSVLSLIGAGVNRLPLRARSPLLAGLVAVFMIGLLAEIIILAWGSQGIGLSIRRVVFQAGGLSIVGAILVFAVAAGINIGWATQRGRIQMRTDAFSPQQQKNA